MTTVLRRALAAAALASILSGCATGAPRAQRDAYVSRVEALALLQTFNAEVLASNSATLTLEKWCREHRMADDPKIVAARVPGASKAPTNEQLQRLGVARADELKYRRVALRCGVHVLSEADNWYVPARLTPEMNALLDSSDTPFGRVVQPLRPYRRTIAATVLWSPLPAGWEMSEGPRDSGPLVVPKDVIEHRALLYTSEHVAFSEVVETYQGELLRFRSDVGDNAHR